MPDEQGLDDEAIERETAVPLPERDAMSVVAGAKLVPLETVAAGAQLNPEANAAPIAPPPSSR
jgi:hypothetical protein